MEKGGVEVWRVGFSVVVQRKATIKVGLLMSIFLIIGLTLKAECSERYEELFANSCNPLLTNMKLGPKSIIKGEIVMSGKVQVWSLAKV